MNFSVSKYPNFFFFAVIVYRPAFVVFPYTLFAGVFGLLSAFAVYLRPAGKPVTVHPDPATPSSQPSAESVSPTVNSPLSTGTCASTSRSSGTVSVFPYAVITRYGGISA